MDALPRYLQTRTKGDTVYYYFIPPRALQRAGTMYITALGKDRAEAIAKALVMGGEAEALMQRSKGNSQKLLAGSIAGLVDRWMARDELHAVSETTLGNYRRVYNRLLALEVDGKPFGEHLASSITIPKAKLFHEQLADEAGHMTAKNGVKYLRWAWSRGTEWGLVEKNPWAFVRTITGDYERDEVWTPAEMQRVIAEAEAMGRPSIANAVRLGYATGARIGDVLRMKKGAYDKGQLVFVTHKTGARIVLKDLPESIVALFEGHRQGHVIVNETDRRPYSYATFNKWWCIIRGKAGLAGRTFHDLRHTTATEMGSGGATPTEMNAVFGWRDQKMHARYTQKTVEQAASGMAKRAMVAL